MYLHWATTGIGPRDTGQPASSLASPPPSPIYQAPCRSTPPSLGPPIRRLSIPIVRRRRWQATSYCLPRKTLDRPPRPGRADVLWPRGHCPKTANCRPLLHTCIVIGTLDNTFPFHSNQAPLHSGTLGDFDWLPSNLCGPSARPAPALASSPGPAAAPVHTNKLARVVAG